MANRHVFAKIKQLGGGKKGDLAVHSQARLGGQLVRGPGLPPRFGPGAHPPELGPGLAPPALGSGPLLPPPFCPGAHPPELGPGLAPPALGSGIPLPPPFGPASDRAQSASRGKSRVSSSR